MATEPDEASQDEEKQITIAPQYVIKALETELAETNQKMAELRRNYTLISALSQQLNEQVEHQANLIKALEKGERPATNGKRPARPAKARKINKEEADAPASN